MSKLYKYKWILHSESLRHQHCWKEVWHRQPDYEDMKKKIKYNSTNKYFIHILSKKWTCSFICDPVFWTSSHIWSCDCLKTDCWWSPSCLLSVIIIHSTPSISVLAIGNLFCVLICKIPWQLKAKKTQKQKPTHTPVQHTW